LECNKEDLKAFDLASFSSIISFGKKKRKKERKKRKKRKREKTKGWKHLLDWRFHNEF